MRTFIPALVAALLLLVVVVGVTMSRRPSHPKQWDADSAPLAGFVERTTGLTFKHPVKVNYLPDAEFEGLLARDIGDVNPAAVEQMRLGQSRDRALGLRNDVIDPIVERTRQIAGGAAAFYEPRNGQVYVRRNAPTIDVAIRVTLVHELTHALQDQRYDLDALYAVESFDTGRARRAVVEGHASWVEDRYLLSLLPAEQQAFGEQSRRTAAESRDRSSSIPIAVQAEFISPYVFGRAFVAELTQTDSADTDTLFTTELPRRFAEVLDSDTWATHREAVVPGDLEDVGRFFDDFGPLDLYFMVVPVVGQERALEVFDAWDSSAERVEEECVTVRIGTDLPAQREVVELVIREWVASRPEAANARLGTVERGVEFTACDAGEAATVSLATDDDMLALFRRAIVRNRAFSGVMGAVDTRDEADCVVGTLIDGGIPATALVEGTNEAVDAIAQASARCS